MAGTRGSDLPSILEVIAARGGTAPDVRLPDEADPPLAISEIALQRTGRYRVQGRIAEGGVGLVLKGHDADLKRDVALKVIREKYSEHDELIRRFVEEAQIGAQLQHPGVVPVHELGLGEDKRPFFAMKLVKGSTLSELLAERADPTEDRRRCLSVFLAVAETMAYAHSRGVIHRDLKSSNVMLGAFGEVQVVDWGFAKVLDRGGVADEERSRRQSALISKIATIRSSSEGSESIAGAVMGTPAYMPPEQALGQIDDLDTRSDVFALGAILTEILTGDPPWLGTSAERLTKAGRGDLAEVVERLDRCGAEAGLVQLAKKCLAPMRGDRPRDAGAVASALAAFLAEAEEREKRSEVEALETLREAAEAETEANAERARAEEAKKRASDQRAKEERHRARREEAREEAEEARRSRRRTMLVAGIALAAVVLGGLATLFITGRQARFGAENAARADALFERSKALYGSGQWDEALAAVKRAKDLVGPAEPRVAAVEKEIADAKAAAVLETKQQKIRQEMARSLEGVLLTGDGDYAAIFGHYGVHPFRPGDEKKVLACKGIEETLTAVFDDWAWKVPKGGERRRLLDLARQVDPDTARGALRTAAANETWADFLAFTAIDAPLDDEIAVEMAGRAVLASGQVDRAVGFLDRAWRRHPDRPALGVMLARALLSLELPRVGEARRILRAVLATRPDCEPLQRMVEGMERGQTDLDAFRRKVGYANHIEWLNVTVSWSAVTGRARRIYFKKAAVTEALAKHKGGRGKKAAPMVYDPGTVFVAESLDEEGEVFRTEAIRIDWPLSDTEYFVFDVKGNRTNEFRKNMLHAPRICTGCHATPAGEERGYYSPMMDFPGEKAPEESRLVIDKRYRDWDLAGRFGEGYVCGSNLFGPYGTIWLKMLQVYGSEGKISVVDRPYYDRLKEKYPDLLIH